MFIIIPLGGTGERFKKNGYMKPKALVPVFGKPILFYLLDNLNLSLITHVCIPYNKEYISYRLEDLLRKEYPHIHFVFIPLKENTAGAAETISIALQTMDMAEDEPVLCLDSDNFYTCDVIGLWNGENKVITFEDYNNNILYSYVTFNDQGELQSITEKQKTSIYACTGAYGFASWKQLLSYTQYIVTNQIQTKQEYYTSGVIQQMIASHIVFHYGMVDLSSYHCLGTPLQLKMFFNNVPALSSIITPKRICFDLDNTLVTFPRIKGDYTTVEPIVENIRFLRYLKQFQNTIIIHTARRMQTCQGNIGKVMCDIGKITFETLAKFDIPFDEIYFGKPHADVYIDDLAMNCFHNMEKELGYYMDTISPRDFNSIEQSTVQAIVKRSKDLSGEIYYYRHIPESLKDLFPVLIEFDETPNHHCLKIEKINGLSMTSMYLSELLKEETLIDVMNSIHRIQQQPVNERIDIYGNYARKLKQRYTSFDFSAFPYADETYQRIYDELTIYEETQQGKTTMIHGDTVMTNIIINTIGKIKFIDMRGKVGSVCTVYGDWLYDWAKLYQSLLGYDCILQGKHVSYKYYSYMIQVFENYFCQLFTSTDFYHLKIITNSLLLSLIPLHNNENCRKYYDLIRF